VLDLADELTISQLTMHITGDIRTEMLICSEENLVFSERRGLTGGNSSEDNISDDLKYL
jgi:hypothetical protein